MEHSRGDTVKTRSYINRNMRNKTVSFIWVTEKIWRVVKYRDYESEEIKG